MKLELHEKRVQSIFDLLGTKENGLTYALGWTFSDNKELLKAFVKRISNEKYKFDEDSSEVRLQKHGGKKRGFTDIELVIDNQLFIIIEAKKGWNLPGKPQLEKYASRFAKMGSYSSRKLVVISEYNEAIAERELEKLRMKATPTYMSWSTVFSLFEEVYPRSDNFQKQILNRLRTYFKKVVKVISMQDRNSNKVFCVALGADKPKWSRLSWIEIVEKEGKYFYPARQGWPADPPNYIAFRYRGKLQSIHHVDSFEMVTKMYKHLPVDREEWDLHFLLTLGKPFRPSKEVTNGKIYPQQHLWFDLDTVFTTKTIREARDITQEREEAT